jgi:hypothetical protein
LWQYGRSKSVSLLVAIFSMGYQVVAYTKNPFNCSFKGCGAVVSGLYLYKMFLTILILFSSLQPSIRLASWLRAGSAEPDQSLLPASLLQSGLAFSPGMASSQLDARRCSAGWPQPVPLLPRPGAIALAASAAFAPHPLAIPLGRPILRCLSPLPQPLW